MYTLTLKAEHHKLPVQGQASLLDEHFSAVTTKYGVPYYVAHELTKKGNVHAHAILGEPGDNTNVTKFRKELRALGHICCTDIYDLEGAIAYCDKDKNNI